MSKKAVLFVVIVSGVVFLSGCSSEESETTITTTTQNQEKEKAQVVSGEEKGADKKGTPPEGGKGGGMMNSEEEIAACSELSDGDECSFVVSGKDDEDMEMTGTCQGALQSEEDEDASGELICIPEMKYGGPGGRGGNPPAELE